MVPPACERRSLLTGISHGEPSRREIRSENHTRPGVQTQPRPRLYHSIQSERSWMSQREPEGTVRCLLSRKQIHLSLAKHSPYLLHYIGVEPPF
ncbi:hypothetical protein PDJAM_G00256220, partial [Pangasius djambal]|nr:hypothetical protein [Pangasius djambal]